MTSEEKEKKLSQTQCIVVVIKPGYKVVLTTMGHEKTMECGEHELLLLKHS